MCVRKPRIRIKLNLNQNPNYELAYEVVNQNSRILTRTHVTWPLALSILGYLF